MSLNPRELIEEVGGISFISDKFVPSRLLTAVACVRRNSAIDQSRPLREYLDPILAKSIYSDSFAHLQEQCSENLGSEFEKRVYSAILNICTEVPGWTDYFRAPMRYELLLDDRTSMTSAVIPQTIYFGRSAFSPHVSLTEVIIHEYAHVWLDFICEVFNLQHDSAPNDYVLPSGTQGKTLQGVLLAAHFAASCLRYYQIRQSSDDSITLGRIDFLHQYLSGCLEVAGQRPVFTEMGCCVYEALQSFCSEVAVRTTLNTHK